MEVSQLLKNINDVFFKAVDLGKDLPRIRELDPIAIETRWLGFPPASPDAISLKETELGVLLPDSFKEFLLTSNGFRDISPFIFTLYPIEKVDWASNIEDPWWLDLVESDKIEMSDEKYLTYGKAQRSEWFRGEYFRNSLKISDWGDACCLYLNPAIKHEGEWEVLFYATWFPGTERHRSFKDFLKYTHKSNLELLQDLNRRIK